MTSHIRTVVASVAGTALIGVGLAGPAQAAPDACDDGGSSCKIVSRADVDGDGRADSVSMTRWGFSDGTSKVTTRVSTAAGEKIRTVTDIANGSAGGYRGAAQIDGEDGYEVVLVTELGAHTAYSQVITYRDGRLTTLQDPRNRYRWVTDGSVWSSYGYTRAKTGAGAVKMIAAEAEDTSPRDGVFRQHLYSAQWKNGKWQRVGLLTRTVPAADAAVYGGWNVPYLKKGI